VIKGTVGESPVGEIRPTVQEYLGSGNPKISHFIEIDFPSTTYVRRVAVFTRSFVASLGSFSEKWLKI